MKRRRTLDRFAELAGIIDTLLGPKGCPWDKRQTHGSLIDHLREEVREYIAAVKSGSSEHMKEELGDILLHIMLHSKIAEQKGQFGIGDVMGTLSEKLRRRHPHVFGGLKVTSVRQVKRNWDRIKRMEKKKAGYGGS